uniref:Reverse transcriptase domain-containing protein n=1 Tax=Leptobrachium leishanense TaxID=445787 RepID=A0A8C5MN92_9ANUR
MATVRLITLKARGLNTPVKRRLALADARAQGGDIVFVQETHFRADSALTLSSPHYSTSYVSNFVTSKSRGVAILIARHVPFVYDSHVSDPGGRFLFLKGTLGITRCTLVNIYLPNRNQCQALRSIFNKLSRYSEGIIICGGDFNVHLDAPGEGNPASCRPDPSLRRRFLHLLHGQQLVDGWRVLHPEGRDFTFFSSAAGSYSRLDTFLVSHNGLHFLKSATIRPITWSDHAPVHLVITLPAVPERDRTWRLNEALLKDDVNRTDIETAITDYFGDNLTPDVSLPMVWEAHKCVLRGKFIQIGARLKRLRTGQIKDLLGDIHTLETSHKAHGSLDTLKELTLQRAALNNLLTSNTLRSLQITKLKYYTQGDRCGRLLANAVRQRHMATYIPKVRHVGGSMAHTSPDISAAFLSYYKALYNLRDTPPPSDAIDKYLRDSYDSTISQEARKALDAPFTMKELASAVKSMKSGKSPGPDGFTMGYYKTFLPSLGPHFLKAFNSLDDQVTIPQSALLATITLLPKPDKDHTLVPNYHPISLINTDVKLFAKLLALRLSPLLPALIHPDQSGFVTQREARDNTIRTINLIHRAQAQGRPTIFLSVDAEKAFDRVDWHYLFGVLRHMGFGTKWMTWIYALYSSPTARIRINGTHSTPFCIRNGTRQGCPLSPLLFVLALEPFMQRVRDNDEIQGFHLPFHHYKISAYADDVLFTLTNPLRSLPHVLKELRTFQTLSNFLINDSKCEAMGVGVSPDLYQALTDICPFQWTRDSLRYLGTTLTRCTRDLFAANYTPLLNNTLLELRKWRKPHISWLGRVNYLKMTILPKFLYVFQAVPVKIPRAYFQALRSGFLKFIWGATCPRISYKDMTRPRDRGGLGLPHMESYYQAALLTRICDWSMSPPIKLWVALEQCAFQVPIASVPWQLAAISSLVISPDHPTAPQLLRLWREVRSRPDLSPDISPLYPVSHNPDFPPGRQTPILDIDPDGPYLPIARCCTDQVLSPLLLLAPRPTHTPLECFKYGQLTHFVTKLTSSVPLRTTMTVFETLCTMDPPPIHVLSSLYALLLSSSQPKVPSYVSKWHDELPESISEEDWTKFFSINKCSSISLSVQLSNFKLLARWYLTPVRLNRMFSQTTSQCWRCLAATGTYVHLWWSCPVLTAYWSEILVHIEDITGFKSDDSPQWILFHLVPLPVNTYKASLLLHLLNAAKSLIPRKWKQTTAPTVREWIEAVERIRTLEELHYSLENQYQKYFRTWFWWSDFLHKRSALSPAVRLLAPISDPVLTPPPPAT